MAAKHGEHPGCNVSQLHVAVSTDRRGREISLRGNKRIWQRHQQRSHADSERTDTDTDTNARHRRRHRHRHRRRRRQPVLFTEQNSDLAIALDSVWFVRDPFPLTNIFNLSADDRTRLMLFGMNLELLPGENLSAMTVRAEDAALNIFPLNLEFVGKVPGTRLADTACGQAA